MEAKMLKPSLISTRSTSSIIWPRCQTSWDEAKRKGLADRFVFDVHVNIISPLLRRGWRNFKALVGDGIPVSNVGLKLKQKYAIRQELPYNVVCIRLYISCPE